MKNWNTPFINELNVKATSAPKKDYCTGLTNGTCTNWCNGTPFGPCDYHPGNKCKLKKNGSTTPTPTPEGTFGIS